MVDVFRSAPPLNTDPGRKLPASDQRPDPIGNLQLRAARLDDLDRHEKEGTLLYTRTGQKARPDHLTKPSRGLIEPGKP